MVNFVRNKYIDCWSREKKYGNNYVEDILFQIKFLSCIFCNLFFDYDGKSATKKIVNK